MAPVAAFKSPTPLSVTLTAGLTPSLTVNMAAADAVGDASADPKSSARPPFLMIFCIEYSILNFESTTHPLPGYLRAR
jgi:hypothetical protein